MEPFEAKSKTKEESLEDALPGALKALRENLKPMLVQLSGRMGDGGRTLELSARCMHNDMVQQALYRIFFYVFSYLPAGAAGLRLKLELCTYSDPSFINLKHSYRMETLCDLMPDTGAVRRDEWERFTAQLIYTLDGAPQTLPEPRPFIDDGPEEINPPAPPSAS
jgi:hypothetical protein